MSFALSLITHPLVALVWLVVGVIVAFFVLRKNKRFLNVSLASIAAKEAAKLAASKGAPPQPPTKAA